MTKEEIQEFVRRNNELLAGAFNIDRPSYRFRYDDEADIVLLDIYDKWGKVRKTRALSYEVTEERFWIRVHETVDLFMALHPDWTDVRQLANGRYSFGGDW